MQLSEPNPNRHRSGSRGDIGISPASILTGGLLIVLGFLIAAVVGVLAGLVSPAQLVAPLTGTVATAAPPAAQPASVSEGRAIAAPAEAIALPTGQQPRVLREETFGDWRFVCLEGVQGAAPTCSAIQQLRVAETGAAVFVWRIVQDGHGGLVGIWRVPDTVLLVAGLTLDAGTPQPLVIPFESCEGGGCQVVANLAPDFIETLSNARTLSASVMLKNRESLKFPLSPTGLGDALAALSKFSSGAPTIH